MSEPIDIFWSWWAEHEDRLLQSMHDGPESWFVQPLKERVDAISEGLSWTFGPSEHAAHHFAISSNGEPKLRVLVERWRAAGPGDSAKFEFFCALQPTANAQDLSFGSTNGEHFDFSDLRFVAEPDDAKQRLHLTVHHPLFVGIPEQAQVRMSFLALDHSVGEDAAETWIGAVEPSDAPPPADAWTVQQLAQEVSEVHLRWKEPSWSMFQAADPETQQRLVLAACTSAKYLLDPLFDTLYRVRIPYEANAEGMPVDAAEAERITSLWDEVEKGLGDRVRQLCRLTGAGVRVDTYYVMGDGEDRRALDALVAGVEGAQVECRWDPGWRELPF